MTEPTSTGPKATDLGPEGPPTGTHELTKIRSRGFFPADHAAVEGGKVYASGAYWAVLRFPVFPAVLPTMSLVAIIEVPFHAYQADHLLTISLVDPDDKLLGFRVEGSFRSAPKIESKYGQPGLAPMVVPVQGLTFERPGDYTFILEVDGKPIDRYQFHVIQIASITVRQPPPSQTTLE